MFLSRTRHAEETEYLRAIDANPKCYVPVQNYAEFLETCGLYYYAEALRWAWSNKKRPDPESKLWGPFNDASRLPLQLRRKEYEMWREQCDQYPNTRATVSRSWHTLCVAWQKILLEGGTPGV